MKTNLESKPMTMTQPISWIEAWKSHMKKTGRSNLSGFIAEAVNKLVAAECKKNKRASPVVGTRGVKGKKTVR